MTSYDLPAVIGGAAVPMFLPPELVAASRPYLQVAEAAAALSGGWSADDLARLLAADRTDLDPVLADLTRADLVQRVPGGFTAERLRMFWPAPLGLGPSARAALNPRTATELRGIAQSLGVVPGRSKADVLSAVTGRLTDPEAVRALVARAPAAVRDELLGIAVEARSPEIWFGTPRARLNWAAERGLLVETGWSRPPVMPAEVALALRGADWHAPFDPRPPAFTAGTVAPSAVQREAAAATTALLATVTAVAGALRSTGAALLKTGGVGVREVRRLAKSTGYDDKQAGLALELLGPDFTTVRDGRVVLSKQYDRFARLPPAEQLLTLISAWLTDDEDPLRPAVVQVLTAIDGTIGPDDLSAQLAWHQPLLADLLGDELASAVREVWADAHAIGLLAHGTLSALGRRLIETGSDADALAEAGGLVPEQRTTALFQADLTAVVGGTPTADLLTLLDGAAVPESRSGAWTWRFTPASVRGALDTGVSAGKLREQLTAAAERGALPQPLTYLIDDVARRHGHIQVAPAGCCLLAEDDALLAEVVAAKALRGLGLRRVAPGVLIADVSADETLAALRAAGYAPILRPA